MTQIPPYILARTMGEAHEFAQERLGLQKGYYRLVNSPSTLSAVRGAELHLVPGWENRFDRFAMKGALRWTRLSIIDHSDDDERGPLTDRALEVAHRYHALRDKADTPVAIICQAVPDDTEPPTSHTDLVARVLPDDSNGDRMVSEGGPVTVLVEVEPEKPKKRRRSRCKDCGDLHFKDEPCAATDTDDPFPVE